MDAKKLTLAVSFMMVLAAAFVLVVPSDSEADDVEFGIKDAYFTEGPQNYFLEVEFTKAPVFGSFISMYFGEDRLVYEMLPVDSYFSTAFTSVDEPPQEGTYDVTVKYGSQTLETQVIWPTPSEHTITVLPAEGGKVTVDPTSAYPNETITISYTVYDTYEFGALYVNGKAITGNTFVMPNEDVTVQGYFKQVMYSVTFMFNETMQYGDKQSVASEGLAVKPVDPSVIGADFLGWFLEESEVAYDFSTPVEDNLVLYAHFGPSAPSTEQTQKFVGAISEDCTLVITAYDGNIVGKGTAKVQIYEEMNIGGYMMYVPVKDAIITVEMDSDDVYFVEDLNNAISELITESGNYALMAQITLDNEMKQTTNYATFVL